MVTAKKLPVIDDELGVGAAVGVGAGPLRRSRERVMVGFTTESNCQLVPSALSLTMQETGAGSDLCST